MTLDDSPARSATRGACHRDARAPAFRLRRSSMASATPARSPSLRRGPGCDSSRIAGAQLVGHLAAPRAGMRILDARWRRRQGDAPRRADRRRRLTIDAARSTGDQARIVPRRRRDVSDCRASVRTRRDLLESAAPLASAYDLISLDAPCSGLGVLRRHPDAKWRLLLPTRCRGMAALQASCSMPWSARLAPGGTLVHACCTFTRAEGLIRSRVGVARRLVLVAERRTWAA